MHVRTIKGRKYLYYGNKLVKKVDILDSFFMNKTLVTIILIALVILFVLTAFAWFLSVFNLLTSITIFALIIILVFIIERQREKYV